MKKWGTHNLVLAITGSLLLFLLFFRFAMTASEQSGSQATVTGGKEHGTPATKVLAEDTIHDHVRHSFSPVDKPAPDVYHGGRKTEQPATNQEFPQNEIIALLEIQDQKERQKLVQKIARTTGINHDFALALNLWEKCADRGEQNYFSRVFIQIILQKNDHQGAGQWALQIPDTEIREGLVALIAENWADTDPEAATLWADSLPEKSVTVTAHDGIIKGIAKKNVQAAYDRAIKITDPELRETLLRQVGLVYAGKFPAAASDWAMDFDTGKIRLEVMNYAVHQWARKDLDRAAQWVENLPDEYINHQIIETISSTMAQDDPLGAANWAGRFATTPEINSILFTIATVWAEKEPEAATRWAQQFSDPRLKSDLTAQTAYHWALSNPRAAALWLSKQPADDAQINGLKATLGVWASHDPAGAASWLETSSLPPATREKVLSGM